MSDTKNTNKKQNHNRVKNNNDSIKRYYINRDGFRVSDREYDTEESASGEYAYWKNLTTKWDPTSKVSIIDKNNIKK